MTRSYARIAFGALVLAVLPSIAWTKQNPETPADVVTIAPNEVEDSIILGDQRVSLETGVPLALYRPRYPVTSGTAEEMVRTYLFENRQLFKLRDDELADLQHHHTRTSSVGHTVRYTQLHRGLPVYKSDLTVTVDNRSTVIFVMNSYKSQIELDDVTPALSSTEARAIASAHVRPEGRLNFDQTTLMVYQAEGRSHLVYRVRLEPSVQPIGSWDILVDARTGDIIKAVDASHYIDGTGAVFDPDPLSSAGATYGQTGYVDGNDADTPQLLAEIFDYTLPDITFSGGMYRLVGPWAEIRDTEAPFEGTYDQPIADWTSFTRTDQEFEASLVYWHIDNYMRYVNLTLGTPCVPFQYSGGARFDPHGLNGADNSHYSGGSGVVAFGDGGVDDSEDADVVIHELGHAIHDWLTVGGLSQVNGLSEGFGDYCAASYSRSLGQWLPSDQQYQWVFSWDGHNPFWPGRRTNHPNQYPGGLTGQIHTDGQIFSTCMMRIWDEIGRERIDKAVFEGLAMTNSSTSQLGAAQAILAAAVAMDYTLEEQLAIYDNMRQTGYDVDSPIDVDDSVPAGPAMDLSLSPNPFNPQTTITYDLSRLGRVEIAVFDVGGRRVASLVDRELTPGSYTVSWDGKNDAGHDLATGIYAIRLTTADGAESRQAVLLK